MNRRAAAPPPHSNGYDGEEPEDDYADFDAWGDEFDEQDEEYDEPTVPGGHMGGHGHHQQQHGRQPAAPVGQQMSRAVPPPPGGGYPTQPRRELAPPSQPGYNDSAPPPVPSRSRGPARPPPQPEPTPMVPQGRRGSFDTPHIPVNTPRKASLPGNIPMPSPSRFQSSFLSAEDPEEDYLEPSAAQLRSSGIPLPPHPSPGPRLPPSRNLPPHPPQDLVEETYEEPINTNGPDDVEEAYLDPEEDTRPPAPFPGQTNRVQHRPAVRPPSPAEEDYLCPDENFSTPQPTPMQNRGLPPTPQHSQSRAAFDEPDDTYDNPDEVITKQEKRAWPQTRPPMSKPEPIPDDIYEVTEDEAQQIKSKFQGGPPTRALPCIPQEPKSRPNIPVPPAPAPGLAMRKQAPPPMRHMESEPEEYQEMDELVEEVRKSSIPTPPAGPNFPNRSFQAAPSPPELNNNRIKSPPAQRNTDSFHQKPFDTQAIRSGKSKLRTVDEKTFVPPTKQKSEEEPEIDLLSMTVAERMKHIKNKGVPGLAATKPTPVTSPSPKVNITPIQNRTPQEPPVTKAQPRRDPLPAVPKAEPIKRIETPPGSQRWSDQSDTPSLPPRSSDEEGSGSGTFNSVKDVRSPVISSAPTTSQPDVQGYGWYRGNIDRKESEALLERNGMFLIRDSAQGGDTAPYTMCVYYARRVRNLKIRLRSDKKYALGNYFDNETTFSTVAQLVKYHKDSHINLAGDDGGHVKLGDCPSQDPEQIYDETQ